MRGSRAWTSAWGAVLVLVLALVLAPAGAANHIACGDSIRSDATLDSDLIGCPGNGIVVRASGVTLDLGGHSIAGSRAGFGVVNAPQTSNLTVVNGAIGGFHHGIVLSGGSGHFVSDVITSEGHDGLLVAGTTDVVVQRVSAWGNDGSGINAPLVTRLTIADSHIFDNAAGIGGLGLDDITVTGNVIERNTFYGVRYAQLTDSLLAHNAVRNNGDHGVRLEVESSGNRLVRNVVTGTAGDGVFLEAGSGANVLEHNRSDRNRDDGFEIAGPGAVLVRNSAMRNGDLGFEAPFGAQVADRNKARHNRNRLQCTGIPCR